MIDYCPGCGIEYRDAGGSCEHCGGQLPLDRQGKDGTPSSRQKFHVNLTDHPIGYLLREWKLMDGASQLLFPVLLLFILIKKLLKRPFLTPVLNASAPEFRIAKPEDLERLNPKKAYGPVMAYLEQQGYTLSLDLVCLHNVQTVIRRIFVNQDHTRYATIFINAASGKMQFLSLEAYTRGKKIIALLSHQSLPINLPENIIFLTVIGAPPEKLAEAFDKTARENGEPLVPLSLAQYLRLHFKVDRFMIAQAMHQGLFLTKSDGTVKAVQHVSSCVNHPMHIAVRACARCGISLCESCYTARGDNTAYCDHCFSSDVRSPSSAESAFPSGSPEAVGPKLEGGCRFAGLGARGLAKLIDLVLIVGMVAIMAYGFNLGLNAVAERYAPALSAIFVQLLAASVVIFYFTLFFQRFSGGVGHRILGMRVVDKNGHAPSLISASIRFVYHLLVCLFIFPAVGYLSIPFRKERRGWHDTLADTWVITRHPKKAGLIGWLALTLICGAAGWVGLSYWHFFSRSFTPDIALKSVWESQSETSSLAHKVIVRGDLVITRDSGKIIALEMQTGNKKWDIDESAGMEIQTPPKQFNLPFIASTQEGSETIVVRIRPEDGAVLWRKPTGLRNAQVIVDRQGILVWSDSGMKWLDVDGVEIWQAASAPPSNATVTLNGDIFFTSYDTAQEDASGNSQTDGQPTVHITCISLTDGGIKWREAKASSDAMGRSLENGYYLEENADGSLSMVFLPERRTVWTIPAASGPVLAAKPDHEQSTSVAPLLYTDRRMIVGSDGAVGFDYPPHRNSPVVTDRWLILMEANTDSHPIAQAGQSSLLVIDRFNGEPLFTLSSTRHEHLVFVSEDKHVITLCAMNPPTRIFSNTFPSKLLLIDKRTHKLREISLGDRFIPWGVRARALRDNRAIFIATTGQMGAYLLPSVAN
jgi:uncharacterized RDD family membrane protein YckC